MKMEVIERKVEKESNVKLKKRNRKNKKNKSVKK